MNCRSIITCGIKQIIIPGIIKPQLRENSVSSPGDDQSFTIQSGSVLILTFYIVKIFLLFSPCCSTCFHVYLFNNFNWL